MPIPQSLIRNTPSSLLVTSHMLPQNQTVAKAAAPRLFVDAMLGRLARWLRLAGYDAAYWRDGSDEALMAAAQAEDRLIVTRDPRWPARAGWPAVRSQPRPWKNR